ncbi:coiled-coil and C2 domain-containing protein 1A-like, partial [Dryobates pubescens]|uniref:coiled-coil and C2 domain-containing protein 1A-like n=1 Tax=Dryobates pubescens TaxID=118200 RepID=UPI0023BA1BAA
MTGPHPPQLALGPDGAMSRARRLPPGRGAAMARQMGLVPELGPAGDPPGDDTAELEAELLALVGGGQTRLAEKPGGRAALPMEAIEEMAALCMRDPEEEEEEEELEDEDDLMAELQEVLGADPGSKATPEPPAKVPGQQGGMEALLAERAALYQAALCSARQAGDGARLRRLERGLK